jgi:two-component system nitrogen regulation sensor histidine kinase NtrY
MGFFSHGRRGLVITLAASLLLFLALATLNAFNLSVLNPASSIQTLVFIALSIIAFLLLVVVLILLVRNVLRLYADQRSQVLGTRLRTRMLWGAVLVSLVPLVFMFLFSYLLMNRSVERWFSQPSSEMRAESNALIENITRYATDNAQAEAESIAINLSTSRAAAKDAPDSAATVLSELHHHDVTLQGGFTIVYRDGKPVASLDVPQSGSLTQLKTPQPADNSPDDTTPPPSIAESVPVPGPAISAIFDAVQHNDGSLYSLGGVNYVLATSRLKTGGLVVVGLPIPADITANAARLSAATANYWALFRERRTVRNLFMTLLLLTTGLALFACCWLALNLSKQVTRPVESLADAMEAIAAGDYAHRVGQSATEELGELVESFNTMAADLESAHATAENSTAQLSQVNATLQQRRTELETIIETIPNGVVTLSADRHIVVANRAFSEMLDPGGQKQFVGLALDAVLPADIVEALDRLLRRAHRMGSASAAMEMQAHSGTLHLSATVAVLDAGAIDDRYHLGYVLVLEDATELLRAQKQSAWKEVARRVAHEIKNPLTPISLNAELIERHVGRLKPLLAEHNIESPSPAVIQRSAEVISASVQTMRSLVDQFSSLAEFPSARPRPADLNVIVENSLALFAGRLGNIRVKLDLSHNLPLVLADPEALKRAFSNLIDNAAEAMQDSLLRELTLSTRLLDAGPNTTGMVELVVADTGPGLPDDMKERLFLPYFSTKQRGTGLGLSIAAKILQEHQGSIRAEKNTPAGAKFIIELRPATSDNDTSEEMITERTSTPAPNSRTQVVTTDLETPSPVPAQEVV